MGVLYRLGQNCREGKQISTSTTSKLHLSHLLDSYCQAQPKPHLKPYFHLIQKPLPPHTNNHHNTHPHLPVKLYMAEQFPPILTLVAKLNESSLANLWIQHSPAGHEATAPD